MKNLSDDRFEKRLKRISKILNGDKFYFSYVGNSITLYEQYIKVIKIITNNRGINEDRQWQKDRLIILDSVCLHISECISNRKNYEKKSYELKKYGLID
jgi:hypothetical protein